MTKEMKSDILRVAGLIKEVKELDPEETESLASEYDAISEMVDFAGTEGVYGTAIFINGQMEAFALGEILSEDTAVEHFEKANDNFRGLYQVICSEFCKALPEHIVYVNREEDMGLEGLRQAKEALKPDHMEEKYTCYFLN